MKRAGTPTLALVALLSVMAVAGCQPGDGPDGAGVPEQAVRYNIIGTALLSQQKWDEAREQFQQALTLRPDDPVPLVNVAVTLIQQANEDEAEVYLRRALEAAPDHPWAHYNLGLIEKNKGNLEQAASHLRVVVDADPDEVAARYNLATILGRLERFDEAEAMYRAALALNPTHVSSLYGLGRLLLQQGRQEEGVEMISLSQQIRSESGIDTAMGNQYGEQGPYAMGVDYPGGGLAAPEAIAVTLRPATPEQLDRVAADDPAVLVADVERARWEMNSSDIARACAVGDVDGDAILENVWVGRPHGAETRWTLTIGGAAQPLDLPPVTDVEQSDGVLVDRDHDGDLDLFGCYGNAAGSRCFMADNDGTGRFEVYSGETGIEPGAISSGPIRLAFSDFDNDRDVDLLVANPGGVHLYSNLRNGSFEDVSERAGLGASVQGAHSIVVADLDKDEWMDLVLGTPGGPVILRNERGRYTAVRDLATASGGERAGAVVLDYDNDGFLDIAALVEDRLRVFRNLGLGKWEDVTESVAAGSPEGAAPLAAVDLDRDGGVDLVLGSDVSPYLLNDGGNTQGWIAVAPDGVNDNTFGIGTKVEVLAGALRQKFEVQQPLAVHAGLGHRERADGVRLRWPGGVLQDEIDLPAGERADVAQLDRKGTSCPLLYAWRDGRWQFVTDFLGGCAIGYRHSATALSVPDTDEYVKIEGGLADDDGTLRVRLNNQLEEVIWFDQAELVVVEHPVGSEVFPDERLMPGPPWPEFGLFVSSDVRPIAAARDVEGRQDVTSVLRERDRDYVEGFELRPFKGYAEMHTLELDLGELPRDERIVLLLDGWIDYADSTANIAASHAEAKLVPPRLSVSDGLGGWNEVEGRMGFPAGLPKTMAVDLTGTLASREPHIRIATTMRIYWDRARVMVGGEETSIRVKRLRPRDAVLRVGGFPAETSPDGKPPFAYDPQTVSAFSPWKAHAGAYTALGNVQDLIASIDDRFVTTRAGDEIELRFDAPAPPAEGFTRTYLLYADGFGKDMDPNSAAASRVGPVPFHGMPLYPYATGTARPVAADDHDRPSRIVIEDGDGAVPLALKVSRK